MHAPLGDLTGRMLDLQLGCRDRCIDLLLPAFGLVDLTRQPLDAGDTPMEFGFGTKLHRSDVPRSTGTRNPADLALSGDDLTEPRQDGRIHCRVCFRTHSCARTAKEPSGMGELKAKLVRRGPGSISIQEPANLKSSALVDSRPWCQFVCDVGSKTCGRLRAQHQSLMHNEGNDRWTIGDIVCTQARRGDLCPLPENWSHDAEEFFLALGLQSCPDKS